MIRVLEVIRQGEIGGGESHVIDLVLHFDRNKVYPIVLAMSDGPMINRLTKAGIECIVIPSQKAFDFSVMSQIRQLVKEKKIDIIHAHGSRAASNMIFVAKLCHTPIIYTVHGWSFHDGQNPLIFLLRAWSEKLICNLAQQVICVSTSNAETGRNTFGLSSEVRIIENGVDAQRFSPNAIHADIRKEFGIEQKAIVVSLIARMTLQKAPLLYLEALEKAHQQNPNIVGLMVGNGDMDNQVENFIQKHGMQSYIKRSAFRTDVPDLLAATDIYCLPSLWEGLSIALLEAMAMARPVIVTPTDGTREVIHHEENGLIVPFHSVPALVKAILTLTLNKEERNKLGHRARATVLGRFNAQHVSEQVTMIYQQFYRKH